MGSDNKFDDNDHKRRCEASFRYAQQAYDLMDKCYDLLSSTYGGYEFTVSGVQKS